MFFPIPPDSMTKPCPAFVTCRNPVSPIAPAEHRFFELLQISIDVARPYTARL